jgi:hypothetical protein
MSTCSIFKITTNACLLGIFTCLMAQVASAQSVFLPRLVFNSAQRAAFDIPDPLCSNAVKFKDNPYTVTYEANKITIRLGELVPTSSDGSIIVGVCPPGPRLVFDIGVLPPGEYVYTYIGRTLDNKPVPNQDATLLITDARAGKAAPYVFRDYSGTWWDPTDPGWGLFIWQDAGSSKDSLLIAWFTYDPTGQPVWYTFQPEWATSTSTKEGPVYRSTRPLGVSTPPPGDTTRVAVGTASIDFTLLASEGFSTRFTYRLGTGAALTKKIVPFKP